MQTSKYAPVAAAHFANDAVTSMFPALLPVLGTRFRLAPSELALLASVFAVSTSLPQPFFGALADRLGRYRVGALGLALSAVLIAVVGTVPSSAGLWLALLVGGLGSAAVHPAGLGIARTMSTANPGLAVALFSSAGMAGGALGPLLAIGLASTWGLEGLAYVAVPVLVLAGWLGRVGSRSTVPTPVSSLGSLGQSLRKGPVAGLAVVALLANLVMLTVISAVPIWLVEERGLAPTSPVLGLTLATFSLAAAVGGLLGSALGRRLRSETLIVGSLAASVIALQSMLVTTPGSVPFVIAVGAAGTLLGLHSPLLIARAQEHAPGAESAVAGVLLGATTGAAGLVYGALGSAQAAFGVGRTLAAVSLLVLPAAHVAALTLRARRVEPARQREAACARCGAACAVFAAAA